MMQAVLQRFSLRELSLLLLGLGAAIAVALLAGLILPEVKAFRATSSAVDVLQAEAQNGAELETRMAEQFELIDKLRFRLHGDMANLPPRQVESYIIGKLQKVSWNNNVELVSVQPSVGERIEVFQEMLFKVQLIGQYQDLYSWLWEARNDLGFIVVKELGLSRFDDNDATPMLKADLSLASYRRVE
ncbi:MAG: hypothetical protein WBM54_03415 [Woeseia sp.]